MTAVVLWLAAAVAIMVLQAVLIAPRRLRRTNVEATLDGLAPIFDGYTIAVVADVHHWGLGRWYLRRIVRMVNDAAPDLIVLLGDYGISLERNRTLSAIAYRRAFPSLLSVFGSLRARDGCVAVLGNHDHYYDSRDVTARLRALDITVLANEHLVLRRGDALLVIGGVGDAIEDRVDPRGGVDGLATGGPIVVLCHNPDGIESLDRDAGIGLVLAGHTHGGQIIIPGYGALTTHTRICGRKTASGWIPNDRVPLYVSRGVGVQVPIRFRCPPELAIVRLRAVANQQPA